MLLACWTADTGTDTSRCFVFAACIQTYLTSNSSQTHLLTTGFALRHFTSFSTVFSHSFIGMQIKGPHHASASEAFPARAGVADWKAHYTGSPGAGVEGAQQWQAVEPPPVNPLDAEGPGKRKVPWSGQSNSTVCCAVRALSLLPSQKIRLRRFVSWKRTSAEATCLSKELLFAVEMSHMSSSWAECHSKIRSTLSAY